MSSRDLSTIKDPFNVTINIEGRLFHTSNNVLASIADSLLADLDKDSIYYHADSNAYCFDRDSNLFPHILAAHRDGEVHVPQDVCALRFRKELEFWRIPKSLIAPCCWKYFYNIHEDLAVIKKIAKTLPKHTNVGPDNIIRIINIGERSVKGITDESQVENNDVKMEKSLCHKISLFLDEPRSSTAAKIWFFIYIFFATVSVFLNIIWIEPWVRVEPYLTQYTVTGNQTLNDKIARLLLTDPHAAMLSLDCFCTVFFTLELCVDFAVYSSKKKYLKDWFRGVKVIVAFSMMFSTVFEFRKDLLFTYQLGVAWFLLKSLSILRIFLLLKLTKLSSTFNVTALAFFSCQIELVLLLFMFGIMIIVYGGVIFAFEMDSDMFPDPVTSMWWALITMSTIGYGDFHPTRPMGYLVGSLCAIEGIIVIALPIAVVVSNFSKYKDRNDDLRKHLRDVEQESVANDSEEPSDEVDHSFRNRQ